MTNDIISKPIKEFKLLTCLVYGMFFLITRIELLIRTVVCVDKNHKPDTKALILCGILIAFVVIAYVMYVLSLIKLYNVAYTLKISSKINIRPSLITILAIALNRLWLIGIIVYAFIWIKANALLKEQSRRAR